MQQCGHYYLSMLSVPLTVIFVPVRFRTHSDSETAVSDSETIVSDSETAVSESETTVLECQTTPSDSEMAIGKGVSNSETTVSVRFSL